MKYAIGFALGAVLVFAIPARAGNECGGTGEALCRMVSALERIARVLEAQPAAWQRPGGAK